MSTHQQLWEAVGEVEELLREDCTQVAEAWEMLEGILAEYPPPDPIEYEYTTIYHESINAIAAHIEKGWEAIGIDVQMDAMILRRPVSYTRYRYMSFFVLDGQVENYQAQGWEVVGYIKKDNVIMRKPVNYAA